MTPPSGSYTAGRAYLRSFRREVAPSWLRAVQVLRGLPAIDLDRPLRLLDLGCGHGFTAALAAAAHPQAEVMGVDIDPENILAARSVAEAAGLTNVRFREASFCELLEDEPGRFDIVVCFGVYTWVDATERARIVRLLDRVVATGGLVCLGYNAMPGWAAASPLRDLARALAAGRPQPGREAATGEAFALLDALGAPQAGVMGDNPALVGWLDRLRDKPLGYLSHELLPEAGTALWSHQLSADMAGARLRYAGSAQLLQNFDAFVFEEAVCHRIEPLVPLGLGEMARDLATNRSFRIDVFMRGAPCLPMVALEAAVEALPIARAFPCHGAEHAAEAWAATAEPCTIGEAADRAAALGADRMAARRALVSLLARGDLLPLSTLTPSAESVAACQRFNAAALKVAGTDDPWPAFAPPTAACGVSATGALIEAARGTGDPAGDAASHLQALSVTTAG